MTDHSELVEQVQAAAEITGDELLQAAASALSSQSLSLSEAREEIERLRKEVGQKHDEANRYVNEMIEWRSAFQRVTPGGSEFTSPQAVRDWADMLKMQVFEANKRAVLAERKALENGPAGLADAHTNPSESDLSSLRKGAEALCPHAPTYDAGLCCGHPDDCTFVSPSGLSKWASATEDGIRAKLLRLAKALHAKHYAHVPQWEPFEDAYGLIDQIDNMTAALVSGSREDGDG